MTQKLMKQIHCVCINDLSTVLPGNPPQSCDGHVWILVFLKGEVRTVTVLSTKACGRQTAWPTGSFSCTATILEQL